MRTSHKIITTAATACLFAAPCLADGDNLDAWFGLDEDTGNITILGSATIGLDGEIEEDFPGPPVYERLFGDGVPDNEAVIGFASFDGVFDPFQGFQLNYVESLLFWDGTGAVSFGSTDSIAEVLNPPGAPISGPGDFFTFQADDEGGFHDDWVVALSEDADTGVYLMQLTLSFQDPIRGSLTGESETTYWVMGFGVDDEIVELAVDQVISDIPAPGALALLGMGLLGTRSRKRRH